MHQLGASTEPELQFGGEHLSLHMHSLSLLLLSNLILSSQMFGGSERRGENTLSYQQFQALPQENDPNGKGSESLIFHQLKKLQVKYCWLLGSVSTPPCPLVTLVPISSQTLSLFTSLNVYCLWIQSSIPAVQSIFLIETLLKTWMQTRPWLCVTGNCIGHKDGYNNQHKTWKLKIGTSVS